MSTLTPVSTSAPGSGSRVHTGRPARSLDCFFAPECVVLSEIESKRVLAAHGIPVVESVRADSEDETEAVATRLGFPVAIKLPSETVTHKAAVGGVYLDVRNAAGARDAWRAIKRDVAARVGAHHFLGVTVEPMVRGDGFEAILGSSLDPQCGPVLLFGSGGRNVEVLQDRALGLPPLNTTLARRLMEQTRLYAALKSGGGRPAVDLKELEQLLARVVDVARAEGIDRLRAEVRGEDRTIQHIGERLGFRVRPLPGTGNCEMEIRA